jgi:hypothetical protein
MGQNRTASRRSINPLLAQPPSTGPVESFNKLLNAAQGRRLVVYERRQRAASGSRYRYVGGFRNLPTLLSPMVESK